MLEISDTVQISLIRPISARSELWKVWGQSTCALPQITLSVDQVESVIDMTGRLLGASWLQFSKYAVIYGNQAQCFIGKEDIIASVAWLHFWEHHFKLPDVSSQGKYSFLKTLPFSKIFIISERVLLLFFFSHRSSCESVEMVPAHSREDNFFLWDREFPITSESDIDCSLTLFHRVVLSLSFWDAVWGCQGAFLVLLRLFVGCFHWGWKITLIQEQK